MFRSSPRACFHINQNLMFNGPYLLSLLWLIYDFVHKDLGMSIKNSSHISLIILIKFSEMSLSSLYG